MSSFVNSADARQLAKTITWHVDNIADDAELKMRLEGIATNRAFGGMTWLWGPPLYKRNRAAFRAFIQQHFSDHAELGDPSTLFARTEPVEWTGAQATALDAWLAEVDRADDAPLFRKLYAWKARHKRGWGVDEKRWAADLAERFAAAATPAQRGRVLEKFELGLSLDEAAALRLYGADASLAKPFILKHLPHRGWRDDADARWHALIARAEAGGDGAFARQLYRRQVPLKRWRDDALALARGPLAAAELLAALDERHPEGHWSDLGPSFHALLEARGAELIPYVQKHLHRVHSWSLGPDSAMALVKLARARGWVDFRIAVLVKCVRGQAWNDAVRETLADPALDEAERLRRLALFSGVSREWNFLGWGFAAVQQLDEKAALALYERYPELLRTQFKAHVTPDWNERHLALFERAWADGDEDLADHLASRYVTHGMWGKPDARQLAPAERAADLLVALKLEPAAFARRAAAILTRVPAYAISDYASLMRNNRLARLLFERSIVDFLADAAAGGAAVRDLVEGG